MLHHTTYTAFPRQPYQSTPSDLTLSHNSNNLIRSPSPPPSFNVKVNPSTFPTGGRDNLRGRPCLLDALPRRQEGGDEPLQLLLQAHPGSVTLRRKWVTRVFIVRQQPPARPEQTLGGKNKCVGSRAQDNYVGPR